MTAVWVDPPARVRERAKAYHVRMRERALAHLGGHCVRCGFSDARALQIDHVHGGGAAEKRRGGRKLFLRVLEDTEGLYQLLCANCNWIKRFENDEHGSVGE